MLVSGYMLRQGIKLWEGRRDMAAKQFAGTLKRYPSETGKATPEAIETIFRKAEQNIATLQTAQAQYNLRVRVEVLGASMTLAEAVKRIGGFGRLEKIWRDAAAPKEDRYAYREDTRESGKEYAVATVTPEEALKRAETYARSKAELTRVIAEGNGTRVEARELDALKELDASLFE